MNHSVIYALTCPDTGDIRYIGKANDAERRFASHLRDSVRRNTPVYCWIRSLWARGALPGLQVLASCLDWVGAERALIAQWRADGARLLNVAEGGDEPFCAPHVRSENGRKVAQRQKADPRKAAIARLKRNLTLALRDGFVSAETRAKMRALAIAAPHEFGQWRNA